MEVTIPRDTTHGNNMDLLHCGYIKVQLLTLITNNKETPENYTFGCELMDNDLAFDFLFWSKMEEWV